MNHITLLDYWTNLATVVKGFSASAFFFLNLAIFVLLHYIKVLFFTLASGDNVGAGVIPGKYAPAVSSWGDVSLQHILTISVNVLVKEAGTG